MPASSGDLGFADSPLIRGDDTGLTESTHGDFQIVDVRFGNLVVSVLIDDQLRFHGISRVKTIGDFLTPTQRLARGVHHDVEKYYQDDEN